MYTSDISKAKPNKCSGTIITYTEHSRTDAQSEERIPAHPAVKTARNYAVMAAICLLIGIVYELFSHGVISVSMIGAFAVPLILGALPNLIIGLAKLKIPGCASEDLCACGIITLTTGTMFKGVLDIFGTTNSLLKYYFIAGTVFFIIGAVLYLTQKKTCRASL